MSSRLRILNVTHVLPDRDQAAAYSPPPLPDDGLVRLSFMDALFVDRAMPMRRLFFYEGPDVPPLPRLVRSLRSSLATALAVFPPLSGKLTNRPSAAGGDVVVDCSPPAATPGVRFVEAEYDGDMRRVAGGSEEGDGEALLELGPELDATHLPAPVLAVQVTRQAGGGGRAVVVGVAVHHAVADGHSVWQFMRAWAALSRLAEGSRGVADLAPPAFDRTPIRYPEAEELARKILRTIAPALPVIVNERTIEQLRSPSSCPPPDRRRRTFLIHADEIQSVKQLIRAQSQTIGKQSETQPSTYLAVSSLVWTSIARAKSRDLAGGDAYFLVAVDYRRRLGPPIDEHYFGDCVVPCVARAAVRDLRDDGSAGLAHAAAAIRDAIRAQPEDPVRGMEAWLESQRTVPRERLTFAGSSNRFMAYETDFGWGAPSRVELVSLFATELVLLLGAPDGGVQ
ncbi:hypothetical protein BAE44_0015014, partial [Dichanthelium oligosanthes]